MTEDLPTEFWVDRSDVAVDPTHDVIPALKYSEDQPRDDHGRFGEGSDGGGSEQLRIEPTEARAFTGKAVPGAGAGLSPQATGRIGEQVALAYLRSLGHADAVPLNHEQSNFPIDAVGDHGAYEIKTGLASNGTTAQHWRATIGEPGPREKEWLRSASADDKATYNRAKSEAILQRKQEALDRISAERGYKVEGRTMGIILDHATKVADVHVFDGFHLRVGWNSEQARAAYVGSFKYG